MQLTNQAMQMMMAMPCDAMMCDMAFRGQLNICNVVSGPTSP